MHQALTMRQVLTMRLLSLTMRRQVLTMRRQVLTMRLLSLTMRQVLTMRQALTMRRVPLEDFAKFSTHMARVVANAIQMVVGGLEDTIQAVVAAALEV